MRVPVGQGSAGGGSWLVGDQAYWGCRLLVAGC